jgi:hypothetical protein
LPESDSPHRCCSRVVARAMGCNAQIASGRT